jgi:sec-independent protein translocase protein TatA
MNSQVLNAPLAFMGIGTTELIILLVILLLLFGGAKLPSLARGLGQSIKEFKKASNGDDEKTTPPAGSSEAKKPETTKTHGSN